MRSDGVLEDPTDAADLFDLLSDETRVRIVGELYDHWRRSPDDPCLPFSALHGRVDAGDTGRFNYHLNRLSGVLVDKRDAGYALSPLGVCLGQLLADGEPTRLRIDGNSQW